MVSFRKIFPASVTGVLYPNSVMFYSGSPYLIFIGKL